MLMSLIFSGIDTNQDWIPIVDGLLIGHVALMTPRVALMVRMRFRHCEGARGAGIKE